MKNKLLISVLIPVYNDPKGLETCLNALSKQEQYADDMEVIVIDNASDISLEDIVKKFPFAKYAYEKKAGSYAARNKGMKLVTGKYIAFTDADCIPESDWLKKGICCIRKEPAHTLVGGEVHMPLSNKPTATELYQCAVGFQQKENIEERLFSVTANLFVKSKDMQQIGFFNENILSGGDRDWCLKAIKKGMTISYCSKSIVNTPPRRLLKNAIKQTRRVAGGRHQSKLLKLNENPFISNTFKPRRSNLQSILWVFKQSHLSFLNRIQIFIVASFLKIITIIETIRLQLGGKPERS